MRLTVDIARFSGIGIDNVYRPRWAFYNGRSQRTLEYGEHSVTIRKCDLDLFSHDLRERQFRQDFAGRSLPFLLLIGGWRWRCVRCGPGSTMFGALKHINQQGDGMMFALFELT